VAFLLGCFAFQPTVFHYLRAATGLYWINFYAGHRLSLFSVTSVLPRFQKEAPTSQGMSDDVFCRLVEVVLVHLALWSGAALVFPNTTESWSSSDVFCLIPCYDVLVLRVPRGTNERLFDSFMLLRQMLHICKLGRVLLMDNSFDIHSIDVDTLRSLAQPFSYIPIAAMQVHQRQSNSYPSQA
jgi:hypothetical protein